jgi:metallo-beta-lactamase class B
MRLRKAGVATVIIILSVLLVFSVLTGCARTDKAAGAFKTDFRFVGYEDENGDRKPNPEPEQIYGPLYHVGPLTVCVYLMKTEKGLVLLDSGYARDGDLVPNNIRKLGFDPMDIKKIFITHRHGDHASGSGPISELTGAEILAHKLDAEALRTATFQGRSIGEPIKKITDLIDGQVFDFGDATVKVIHTPGQTPGEVVFLVTVNGPQGTCRALVAGDATGFKSSVREFEGNKYPGVCEDYEKTVKILKAIEFDCYLGGHPHQVYDEMRADGNPFVTREQWHKMVDNRHQQKKDFLKAHPEYAGY